MARPTPVRRWGCGAAKTPSERSLGDRDLIPHRQDRELDLAARPAKQDRVVLLPPEERASERRSPRDPSGLQIDLVLADDLVLRFHALLVLDLDDGAEENPLLRALFRPRL